MTGADLQGDLEAFLEAEFELPDEGPYERPQDEKRANAMLRKLAVKQRELAQIAELAEENIRKFQLWRDDRSAGVQRQITFLEQALEGYARAVLEGRVKDKKLSYPDGTLALRAKPVRAVITDEVGYELWATSDEARKALLVETVTTLKRDELRKVAEQGPALETVMDDGGVVWLRWQAQWGGEVIPGVEIRKPKEDGFSANPS